MEDKYEKLGQLIDSIENLTYALNLQISDAMHVEAMRSSLPDIVSKLKESFIEITGEDPWL